MDVLIVTPMLTEAQLRAWERGITRVVGRADAGPVRDPAFTGREPNPVIAIRTEDGQPIYIESLEGSALGRAGL